jgi:integrase/recombinase XerD
MKSGPRRRKAHFCDTLPKDPKIKRWSQWISENKGFYAQFLLWLRESGCGDSTLGIYGTAARQALGFWDKPYWVIDPETDIPVFREHLQTRNLSLVTLKAYQNGLEKWEEFWRLRLHKPPRPKRVNWEYYLDPLPAWLAQDVRGFITYHSRAWRPERRHETTLGFLSHLTVPLRWMAAHAQLADIGDLTPDRWYDYVDARLQEGIQAVTLNDQMLEFHHFLRYLQDEGRPVCARTLLTGLLEQAEHQPRDVPVEQLRRLFQEIQVEATAYHRARQRGGRMDLAWFLLMLHSGLRTCEVRSLRFEHLDLAHRRVRIEQSKGLKDRMVYLTDATIAALQGYLAVRGLREALPEQIFLYSHKPLTRTYCGQRLDTYARRCGVRISAHQLRHSCASLLLNAGAPVLTVQSLLGHKFVDTTMRYARLYDGTVAAGYYGAMAEVERRLKLSEEVVLPTPSPAELVALVDSLSAGSFHPGQTTTLQALRDGILALARPKPTNETIQDVNELTGREATDH